VVAVQPGQTTVRDFELRNAETSGGLVRMEALTVSTGREGQAKAIMEQKAAMTATNVIAADSFGSLAEGNVAELLQYLPGVEVNPDGALSSTVSIRGMSPEYGGLTIDGMAAGGSPIGTGRAPTYTRTNLNAVDLVELNKTVSADMDASAPAGTVNLKSKTAFQRTGRFIAWQAYVTGTSADMHFNKTYGADNGRHRKLVPGGSLEYSDVLFGGKLGVVASTSSTTTYLPHRSVTTTYDRVPTAAQPAPRVVSQLTFTDTPVYRTALNNGLSLDYKLGDKTTLSLRGTGQFTEHAFYGRNIQLIATRASQLPGANATTMNVAPGPATTNNPRMVMSAGGTARDMTIWMLKPSITYVDNRMEFDAAVAFNRFEHEYIQNAPTDGLGQGQVTSVSSTLFPIGWTATRGDPGSTAWNIIQTGGADFRVPERWQASATTNNVNRSLQNIGRDRLIGQMNFKYRLSGRYPLFFKAGIKSDEQIYRLDAGSYAYTYVGPERDRTKALIPVARNTIDLPPERYGTLFSNPVYVRDLTAVAALLQQHPGYFEPAAANATNATNLFPERYVRERIDSAYVMGNLQWNKWMFQGGVRTEETRHVYRVYERNVAERRRGKYDGTFASAAAKYRFRPDLIATLGFSQSIRRPDYGNLTGVATINDNLMTGNIPNPTLKPEWGNNYSARLEYYFEPAGNISASVFQSNIEDLIYQRTLVPAEEIGLGGEYPGYLFTSWGNRGASFRIRGFELEYRQQLIFLPGVLRGLGVFANYTRTENSDPNYQFNIAPATASGGVSFRYRRINTSVRASWTDEKIFSATDYVKPRTMVGLSLDYRISEKLSFFVTGRDLNKAPIQRYDREYRALQTYDYRFATQWTLGVSGTF
jgi:TonB-dependent receptor